MWCRFKLLPKESTRTLRRVSPGWSVHTLYLYTSTFRKRRPVCGGHSVVCLCLFEVWASVLVPFKSAGPKRGPVEVYVTFSILLTSDFPVSGITHFLFDLAPRFFSDPVCQYVSAAPCVTLRYLKGVCVCVYVWEDRCVFNSVSYWWPFACLHFSAQTFSTPSAKTGSSSVIYLCQFVP